MFWACVLYCCVQLIRREARKTLAANYIREYDLAHPRQGIRFSDSDSPKSVNEMADKSMNGDGMISKLFTLFIRS